MSETPAFRPVNHPFPFLLYVEWALLGLAIVSEFTPTLLPRAAGLPVVTILSILGFGALGLWLPTKPLGLKIIHVVAQFGLVLLTARLGTVGLRLFPLLYIVLVLRSCLVFQLRGRLVVTGVTFAFFLSLVLGRLRSLDGEIPRLIGRRLLPQLVGIRLNLILMFLLLLVFLLLLMNALLSERERRDELRRANQKLRDSAAQIEKLAMAQERTRIARDIHDSLGHALTGLNIQLEGALKLWDKHPEQARQFVTQAKEMGSMALQEARQAVATLRETPEPGQDLAAAIAPLIERFQQVTGITPQVKLDCFHLPPSLQLTVYRILQEVLTNICKYANANQVSIAVQTVPDSSSQLHIVIQDNGVGFSPQDNTTGYGLKGIQERAAAEGGQFQLTSAPGAGCTVQIWLPLPSEVR